MANPVSHFEIIGKHGAKLQKFYSDLFGWKFQSWGGGPMEYWIVDTGDASQPGIHGGLMRRVHPEQPYAFTIEVGDVRALPQSMDIKSLESDLLDGKAKLLNSDPYLRILNDEVLPAKHKEIRDNAFQFIEELVSNQPAIYYEDKRWKLIVICIEKNKAIRKTTHKTIYRYLRQYWQRGQTKNALLPTRLDMFLLKAK